MSLTLDGIEKEWVLVHSAPGTYNISAFESQSAQDVVLAVSVEKPTSVEPPNMIVLTPGDPSVPVTIDNGHNIWAYTQYSANPSFASGVGVGVGPEGKSAASCDNKAN